MIKFRACTAFLVLFLLVGLCGCGYSGPRVTFIVELDFRGWLLNEASDTTGEFKEVMNELDRILAEDTLRAVDALREALLRKQVDAGHVSIWFLEEEKDLADRISFSDLMKRLDQKWQAANDMLLTQLRTRFDAFGKYAVDLVRDHASQRLSVTVNQVDDLRIARQLIQRRGEFGLYATYGIREIGPSFRRACQSMIMSDTLNATPDLAGLVGLDGQIVQNKSAVGGRDNATIGVAAVRDTHQVNRLLGRILPGTGLPADLKWAWSAKPLHGMEGQFFELYALRTVNGEPEMDGSVITDAHPDKNTEGETAVSIYMNSTGSKNWEAMTTQNQSHQIAMVVDGAVYCAPYVETPIPGGRAQLLGHFSEEEARVIAAVLKSGKLPAGVRIIGEAVQDGSSK